MVKQQKYLEVLEEEKQTFIDWRDKLEDCHVRGNLARSNDYEALIYAVLKKYITENLGFIDEEIKLEKSK